MKLQVVFNHSASVAKQIDKQVADIIERATLAVEADAKKHAPVDTGALRNSLQSSFPTTKTGVVSASVEYAPYVELGTIHNRPQPFLLPALRAVAPKLRTHLRAIGGKLR